MERCGRASGIWVVTGIILGLGLLAGLGAVVTGHLAPLALLVLWFLGNAIALLATCRPTLPRRPRRVMPRSPRLAATGAPLA